VGFKETSGDSVTLLLPCSAYKIEKASTKHMLIAAIAIATLEFFYLHLLGTFLREQAASTTLFLACTFDTVSHAGS
jgi:hypothetical protein